MIDTVNPVSVFFAGVLVGMVLMLVIGWCTALFIRRRRNQYAAPGF